MPTVRPVGASARRAVLGAANGDRPGAHARAAGDGAQRRRGALGPAVALGTREPLPAAPPGGSFRPGGAVHLAGTAHRLGRRNHHLRERVHVGDQIVGAANQLLRLRGSIVRPQNSAFCRSGCICPISALRWSLPGLQPRIEAARDDVAWRAALHRRGRDDLAVVAELAERSVELLLGPGQVLVRSQAGLQRRGQAAGLITCVTALPSWL